MQMIDDLTHCPNRQSQNSVYEDIMRYRCCECDYWGPSPDKIIYEPEQDYHPSGQVCRKPRAA